jgi:flavin-dependent dehydrogenase
MHHEFDVIIAGGGPAGSSTANFLRQRGRTVLVLEKERFPRFHIGESLLPFANDLWKELGVFETMDATYIHKPGAMFVHEESGATFTYYFDTAIRPGRPYAYQVKRADFDKMLLDEARRKGADVREETRVDDVTITAGGVTARCTPAEGAPYEVTAKFFVDATGRDALMANRHRLKEPDGLITTNVAVHTMFKNVDRTGALDEGNIIIGLFDGGWYWAIPFKDGDTSVGFVFEKSFTKINRGSRPEEMFDKALESTPHLARRLANATKILEVGSQANWSYRCRQFYSERMLMVGDAAAFVDPLFSTGVLLAVNGAKFAADRIDGALTDDDYAAERFAGYQADYQRGMDIFKTLVHEFYAQNLRKVLMVSARNPTVCSVITSMLAGDVYKPSMWHSIVRQGFSHTAEAEGVPGVTSSRELLAQAEARRRAPKTPAGA